MNQPREILLRTIADLTSRVKYDFTLLKSVTGEIIPQTEFTGTFQSCNTLYRSTYAKF